MESFFLSKAFKNKMFKFYGSKLHFAQLCIKIKEFLFSTFLVFFSIFWYLWVSWSLSSSNYSKNNFVFNLHGTFSIKLEKVIFGSFWPFLGNTLIFIEIFYFSLILWPCLGIFRFQRSPGTLINFRFEFSNQEIFGNHW